MGSPHAKEKAGNQSAAHWCPGPSQRMRLPGCGLPGLFASDSHI
jgi:hypothetical protein